MHFSTLTGTALVLLSGGALGEDLLAAAATVTDLSSYEKALSSDWASVYYQVNQNLQSLYYLGSPGEYDAAASLYGTTRIPAGYVPSWGVGLASRAKEDAGHTASSEESSDEATGSSSHEESSGEFSDSSEGLDTSEDSDTSGAAQGNAGLGRIAGALLAVVAVVAYV
ncbi:hypothetical protein IWW55_000337 [Coemansia sp. RSA 2706]|nr:hypothetical protein IWW55_000337 [Coemansia sp. RSA 2706]KAJ2309679.1 hypothetical protein IWW52_005624 [Coemansia sp. RSA 2704]KAJ2329804.1 hypothetical protein IWW51_000368 [Coemansia sp. RSA 2702]KAJ2365158.1 hypothetical protein H4S01_003399 [Coemansia sp. RSA 2610]KAJ2392647.1 hypothetical protein H4S02_000668 [Coemansia sp. RSA 2611]KAJ2731227.1 hypothetical protein H4R23_003123 [Coemansia sp. Cherry 401B]